MPCRTPSAGYHRLLTPTLLLLALLLASTAAHSVERSIDLSSRGSSNNLESTIVESQSILVHPHNSPGKPSKLDLDVSQYTETDDESLLEIERRGTTESSVVVTTEEIPELTKPTTPTSPEEETTSYGDRLKARCDDNEEETLLTVQCIEKRIKSFLRTVASKTPSSAYDVTDSVQITRKRSVSVQDDASSSSSSSSVSGDNTRKIRKYDEGSSLVDQLHRFAREHVVNVKLPRASAKTAAIAPRTFFGALAQGKSTFLTGFGLGFLAFGLKKLLLPLFIGVQIVKSILIALFLPSIIGSLGKIVGKGEYGVSSFAQSSQNPAQQLEENYEFKDNTADIYNDDYMARQPLGTLPASAMYDETMLQPQQTSASGASASSSSSSNNKEIMSRYAFVDPRLTPMNALTDRYYTRHVVNPAYAKKQDFKVFHEIPTSSLMLTNYDPFYSPLLSRLDAVFARLGHNTEGCREYAVCAMYRSPARYAPYSNLVSAQLSRELNELRKPSSDNPDVLRFFRYMKSAKDGQDGVRCEDAYADCPSARDDQTIRQNQAMLATYQDIDKLVHARKL